MRAAGAAVVAQQLVDQRGQPRVFVGQPAQQEAAQPSRAEAERAAQAFERQRLGRAARELAEAIVELRECVLQRQAVESRLGGLVDIDAYTGWRCSRSSSEPAMQVARSMSANALRSSHS